jgi:hypothetical protein
LNSFCLLVNLSKIGTVPFDIKVESPTGIDVPVTFEDQIFKKVRLIPKEKGFHRVTMKLGGKNLNGSPFEVNCIDPRVPTLRGNGLYHGIINEMASFFINMPTEIFGDISVEIQGSTTIIRPVPNKLTDGVYQVQYTPKEVGLFKIFINWNNKRLPGCPFLSHIINPAKIKFLGEWKSAIEENKKINLDLNEETTINIDTTDAGPGKISNLLNLKLIKFN